VVDWTTCLGGVVWVEVDGDAGVVVVAVGAGVGIGFCVWVAVGAVLAGVTVIVTTADAVGVALDALVT